MFLVSVMFVNVVSVSEVYVGGECGECVVFIVSVFGFLEVIVIVYDLFGCLDMYSEMV